jgi:Co/Zn/Cd efflux system component
MIQWHAVVNLINIGHMTEQLSQLHHAHAHTPPSFGRAFAVGIGLNMAFVLIEAGYGLISNSVALLADAGHNISDVLGLVIACLVGRYAGQTASI